MTADSRTPPGQYRQPPGNSRRRNRLAITAAAFAVFALWNTVASLMDEDEPGADAATSYAVGHFAAPLIPAIVALACGIPALLRTRRTADQEGRSWDGKEPAMASIVFGGFVTVTAIVRIAVFLASR